MVPSLPLLSCESSVSVKENPDGKKILAFKAVEFQIMSDGQTFNFFAKKYSTVVSVVFTK